MNNRHLLHACACLIAACGGEQVGMVRLALGPGGAPDGVDRMTLTMSAPDVTARVIDVNPDDLTFDVPVPAGAGRSLTLLAEHEDGSGSWLPWYWGMAGFDVAEGEVVDVVVPAVPAGVLVPTVLVGDAPLEGVTVTSALEEPLAGVPDRFEGRTDEAGETSLLVPAGRHSLSAEAEVGGVLYSTPVDGGWVEARQGETVRFPLVLASIGEVDRLELDLSSVGVGETGDVVVRVVDVLGEAVSSFDGVVELEATDPSAIALPAPYRFVPETDAGEHVFEGGLAGLLPALGVIVRASIQGEPDLWTERTIDVLGEGEVVGDAVRMAIEILGDVDGGLLARPVDLRVTAFDPADRVATGYRGTVTFADSDLALLALPPDTAFSADDRGSHLFADGLLPLVDAGVATLRVHDVDDPEVAGEIQIEVQ